MKYQAYPEYKDSGVEWLGKIPKHWGLTRIKFITQCLDGIRIPLNAQERGDMQGYIPYWGANKVVDYINDFLFDEDLVLLGEDGAPFFDKTKDVAFNVSGKIWPNNHVHVLRPDNRKIEFRFLKYAINCADFHLYISGSTRDKLNQFDMNEIYIRCCQLSEQEVIANFLDHMKQNVTRDFDALAKVFDVDPAISKERIAKDIEAGVDRSNVPPEAIDRQHGNFVADLDKIEADGYTLM